MGKQPLNLPEGSVRAILAILLVGGWIASLLLPIQIEPGIAQPLTGTASLVIGFYFGARNSSPK